MGEKLRGKEMMLMMMENGAADEALPFVDSLLDRLKDFDLRLRQLEEKPMLPEIYSSADLRSRRKQRASSKDGDQHLKAALLDRLNLLESRIRQLGRDLDRGIIGEEITAVRSPAENRQLAVSSGGPEEAEIHQTMVSNKKKSRDSMPAATIKEAEKMAAALRRKERTRMKRIRLYRRWFPVGC